MSDLPRFGLAEDLAAPAPATDSERLLRFVQQVAPLADAPVPRPEATVQLVSFVLGNDLFALPVDRIREIVRVGALTRVPQAPDHVRGVQSLRGTILPVLEVRTRLGLPALEVTPASRVVVAEGRGRLLGLLVDAVLHVARVPLSSIQPPPPEVRSRLSEHVVGVAQLSERLALVLELDRLLLLPPPEETL